MQQILQNKLRDTSVLIIDGDNVRGKTKFMLSKEELLLRVENWLFMENMQGKVLVVYDHASKQSGYMLDSGLGVIFAGPDDCADDVIARDVPVFHRQFNANVVVVTDDKELRRRCSRDTSPRIMKKKGIVDVSSNYTISIISSTLFADYLMSGTLPSTSSSSPSTYSSVNATKQDTDVCFESIKMINRPQVKLLLSDMNSEIDLRRKLAQVQTVLARSSRQNKARILSRAKQIEFRLGKIHASKSPDSINTLAELSKVLNVSIENDIIYESRFEILSEVLNLLKYDKSHVEDTWERVILAERLRSQLETSVANVSIPSSGEQSSLFLDEYVRSINHKYGRFSKVVAPLVMS